MQKNNNRLGSGIDALLGSLGGLENSDSIPTAMIPVSIIVPNKRQPRQIFNEESLKELAESIRRQGILQPLLLEEHGPHYRIVAGERRWRASQIAGLEKVPAIVRSFTSEERLIVSLLENIQRENISALEEAQAYKELMAVAKLNQQELADRLGKSRSAVANTLRLLNLPQEIRDALSSGELSAGHARALLAAGTEELQKELLEEVRKNKISVRTLESRVQKKASGRSDLKQEGRIRDFYKELQNKLSGHLNASALITPKKEGGVIRIEFENPDDLRRILGLLQFNTD